jgi:hypothetical protein
LHLQISGQQPYRNIPSYLYDLSVEDIGLEIFLSKIVLSQKAGQTKSGFFNLTGGGILSSVEQKFAQGVIIK